jgi:hypothetical protein
MPKSLSTDGPCGGVQGGVLFRVIEAAKGLQVIIVARGRRPKLLPAGPIVGWADLEAAQSGHLP